MDQSLHSFTMKEAFNHEDEGTAASSPVSVINVMATAEHTYPGIITAHQLARALDVILRPKGFEKETTLLTTSFCCDEVCRDLEDELRRAYGQNFSLGGIAGFPFGGAMAFGAMARHIPTDGQVIIVYGPHVGIDYDGVVGKVNRRGHSGSGSCCNSAKASMAYVKAVKDGAQIHAPDPSDPINAQQVFVGSALMPHADRLLGADNPEIELPYAVFDCQKALLKRIMDKCCPKDFVKGTKIALLGGIQINTPEGTPEYFLPKAFSLLNSDGELQEDLIHELINEGQKDIRQIIREKRLSAKMKEAKGNEFLITGI
jgi:hypothetical protein